MVKFSMSQIETLNHILDFRLSLLVGDKTSEIEILRSFQFPHCPVIGLLDKGNEV